MHAEADSGSTSSKRNSRTLYTSGSPALKWIATHARSGSASMNSPLIHSPNLHDAAPSDDQAPVPPAKSGAAASSPPEARGEQSAGLGLYISQEQAAETAAARGVHAAPPSGGAAADAVPRVDTAPSLDSIYGMTDEPNVSDLLNDVMHWDINSPVLSSGARQSQPTPGREPPAAPMPAASTVSTRISAVPPSESQTHVRIISSMQKRPQLVDPVPEDDDVPQPARQVVSTPAQWRLSKPTPDTAKDGAKKADDMLPSGEQEQAKLSQAEHDPPSGPVPDKAQEAQEAQESEALANDKPTVPAVADDASLERPLSSYPAVEAISQDQPQKSVQEERPPSSARSSALGLVLEPKTMPEARMPTLPSHIIDVSNAGSNSPREPEVPLPPKEDGMHRTATITSARDEPTPRARTTVLESKRMAPRYAPPNGVAPPVKGAMIAGGSPPLSQSATFSRAADTRKSVPPPPTVTSPRTEARHTWGGDERTPVQRGKSIETTTAAPREPIPGTTLPQEAPTVAKVRVSEVSEPQAGSPEEALARLEGQRRAPRTRTTPEPLRRTAAVYGYTGEAWDELLDMEVATAYVVRIVQRIRTLGVDVPLLLSTMAVDLSAQETKRLTRAVIETLQSPRAEADEAFDEELKFANVYSLVALLKWVLAQVGCVSAVRSENQTLVLRQERGFMPWSTYLAWRAQESAEGFTTLSYLMLTRRLEKRVARLLDTVMDFLALVATHSTQNQMTPSKVGRHFGVLLFGVPEDASFAETYAAYVRASNATEHMVLAFMRYHVSMAKASTYLPRRLLRLIDDYPRMLSPDLDAASGAVQTVPATYVARHVREYSHDLIDRAAWPEMLRGLDYAEETCKMLNVVPYRLMRPRSAHHRHESPAELADGYVSALMQRWNEFSFEGFNDLDTSYLAFDLRESDRKERMQRPQSMPWFQFEQRGFNQNADDNSRWDWVMRLDEPARNAPVLVQNTDGTLPRSSSHYFDGAEIEFPYSTDAHTADTVMDELFPEVWADYLVGTGWSNRDEHIHRDASFAVLQLTRNNGSRSSSTSWYVLEEVVPAAYRDTLDQMGKTRRHSIPMLRKLNQFRMVRAGLAPESTVSVTYKLAPGAEQSATLPQAAEPGEADQQRQEAVQTEQAARQAEAEQRSRAGQARVAEESRLESQARARREESRLEKSRDAKESYYASPGSNESHAFTAERTSPSMNVAPPPPPKPVDERPHSKHSIRRIFSTIGSPRRSHDISSPRSIWSPIMRSPQLEQDSRDATPENTPPLIQQTKPSLISNLRKRSSQWIVKGKHSIWTMRSPSASSQDEHRDGRGATYRTTSQRTTDDQHGRLSMTSPFASPRQSGFGGVPGLPEPSTSPATLMDHDSFSPAWGARSRHSSPVMMAPPLAPEQGDALLRPAPKTIPRKQTPTLSPDQIAAMTWQSQGPGARADTRAEVTDENTPSTAQKLEVPDIVEPGMNKEQVTSSEALPKYELPLDIVTAGMEPFKADESSMNEQQMAERGAAQEAPMEATYGAQREEDVAQQELAKEAFAEKSAQENAAQKENAAAQEEAAREQTAMEAFAEKAVQEDRARQEAEEQAQQESMAQAAHEAAMAQGWHEEGMVETPLVAEEAVGQQAKEAEAQHAAQEAAEQEAKDAAQRAEREAAQREAAQREAAQREAAQHEAAQREAAQREAAQREAAQHEAAQREAAQREAAQREAAQHEAAQHEAAQREAAQREAAQREAAQREAAQREAAEQAAVTREAETRHAEEAAAGAPAHMAHESWRANGYASPAPPLKPAVSFITRSTPTTTSSPPHMPNPWAQSPPAHDARSSIAPPMSWTALPASVPGVAFSSSAAAYLSSPESPDFNDDAQNQFATPPLIQSELGHGVPFPDDVKETRLDRITETNEDESFRSNSEMTGAQFVPHVEPSARNHRVSAYLDAVDEVETNETPQLPPVLLPEHEPDVSVSTNPFFHVDAGQPHRDARDDDAVVPEPSMAENVSLAESTLGRRERTAGTLAPSQHEEEAEAVREGVSDAEAGPQESTDGPRLAGFTRPAFWDAFMPKSQSMTTDISRSYAHGGSTTKEFDQLLHARTKQEHREPNSDAADTSLPGDFPA